MTKVLAILPWEELFRQQFRERFATAFPQLTVNVVDNEVEAAPYIGDAEVLLAYGFPYVDVLLPKMPKLRWIQAFSTGVNGLADAPSLPKHVFVTNIRGIQAAPVAEYVVGSIFALSRDLPGALRAQAKREWLHGPSRRLDRRTVGVVGSGRIAMLLAPMLKALGMNVIGITGTPRDLPGFDRVVSHKQLLEVTPSLDHLALVTALTDATRGLVDARVLAAMKPTAYLINAARGEIVDEPALIAALRAERIAGAALDVFNEEPLPADHPFWGLKNVIVTGHAAAANDRWTDDAFPIVEANMRAYLAGDPAKMFTVVKAGA